MTKLNRRVSICVLSVALLVLLLVVLHNYRARRALAARKALLVSQGERFTVEELTPLSSPEAQRAASDFYAGKLEPATANLTALISLANAFHDERTIISQLVRIAIAAIALGPTWEALQTDGWNDAQLATLQQHWASLEFRGGMEKAVEMERASGIGLFQQLRNA